MAYQAPAQAPPTAHASGVAGELGTSSGRGPWPARQRRVGKQAGQRREAASAALWGTKTAGTRRATCRRHPAPERQQGYTPLTLSNPSVPPDRTTAAQRWPQTNERYPSSRAMARGEGRGPQRPPPVALSAASEPERLPSTARDGRLGPHPTAPDTRGPPETASPPFMRRGWATGGTTASLCRLSTYLLSSRDDHCPPPWRGRHTSALPYHDKAHRSLPAKLPVRGGLQAERTGHDAATRAAVRRDTCGVTRRFGVGGRGGPPTILTPPPPPTLASADITGGSPRGAQDSTPGPLPPNTRLTDNRNPRPVADEGSGPHGRRWLARGDHPPPSSQRDPPDPQRLDAARRETPPAGHGDQYPPGSMPRDLHNTARPCTTPQGTHAAEALYHQLARPAAPAAGMAHNLLRWTRRTGRTVRMALASDAASNDTVRLALNGFQPFAGAALHPGQCTRAPPLGGAPGHGRGRPASAPGRPELGRVGGSWGGSNRRASGKTAGGQSWPAEPCDVHVGLSQARPAPASHQPGEGGGQAPVLNC